MQYSLYAGQVGTPRKMSSFRLFVVFFFLRSPFTKEHFYFKFTQIFFDSNFDFELNLSKNNLWKKFGVVKLRKSFQILRFAEVTFEIWAFFGSCLALMKSKDIFVT